VQLLLLPGMDGTSQLFEPLIAALPPTLRAVTVSYPANEALGYEELLALIEAAVPHLILQVSPAAAADALQAFCVRVA
jgi:hypothetical protein